ERSSLGILYHVTIILCIECSCTPGIRRCQLGTHIDKVKVGKELKWQRIGQVEAMPVIFGTSQTGKIIPQYIPYFIGIIRVSVLIQLRQFIDDGIADCVKIEPK